MAAAELAASLPEGAEFPSDPTDGWDVGGSFEEGTGEVAAVLHWRCEWATEYVVSADAGEAGVAVIALDRLAGWGGLREVRDHSDGETRTTWLERVVEPARAGDDAALRSIQADCTQ